MRTNTKIWGLLLLSLLLLSFTYQKDKIHVYLIGDSTMSEKDVKAFPETGWGMPFRYFFDSTVVIENHAKNGRSTRSFISENRWKLILQTLKPGDYVFIQFGHNDEVKEKVDRYTAPDAYQANLLTFINDTKAKGAIPVLLTPVSRRNFKDGILQESHAEYSELVRGVARQSGVAFIDLDNRSKALLQSFGEDKSTLLFLHLLPGEHPNYPEGKTDNTHFNELGARKIAQIVLQEIVTLHLGLADRVTKPVKKP